jgi:hypothetical protein
MIDESEGEHQAALLVHHWKAARAQTVVVTIVAHAKLLFTAKRCDRHDFRELGVARRLHAVFDAVAIGVKASVNGAVVQLQRVEITIGKADHLRARHRALHGGVEYGLIPVTWVFELNPRVRLAHDYRFGFLDAAGGIHFQSQTERGLLDMFLHRSKIPDLPCERIGEAQPVAAHRVDSAPQAVADREHDVILGGERSVRPPQRFGVASAERSQIGVEYLVECSVVHD